ncbi:MAG: alpha-L-fucosidase [Bacteroidaceae bacterium]|nr:alpha-L-fucosidase [Bacteroidaceae bacterium]
MSIVRKFIKTATFASLLFASSFAEAQEAQYVPTPENLKARQEFTDNKFGIFIHWGIYSMFAQGEWYLQNYPIDKNEYAKAADAFYPHRFDAKEWVAAIKDAGAKYICFTSRHHDGFSMWNTEQSNYNIVDATPFGRDVLKELADECHKQGIKLHLYYSHIDWARDEYPMGSSGRKIIGRVRENENWPAYYSFMNKQLTELLTNYGEIGAIWFDGKWDRYKDSIPFDWRLDEQYALIHKLQPSCLIGNNHHATINPGEDIQIFERDIPGENKAGFSGQEISRLPLETCETMNGMWGYKLVDQDYKSAETLLRLLICTSGKGANLLLNVGPQPNGQIPAVAIERMKKMGEWLRANGETIYGTTAGDIPAQEWGVTTRKGERLFVHILNCNEKELLLPLDCKVKKAFTFADKQSVKFKKTKEGVRLMFDEAPTGIDYIVELITK